jgi:mannose-6-phosphate isomerase-like protein (cupin superfamily)
MLVKKHIDIEKMSIPGLVHQTLAGPRDGMKDFEVWMQTIAPGQGTPVHKHDCEEVVVVFRGSGVVRLDNRESKFGPDSTLIIERNVVHQIVNSGDTDMFAIGVLGMAPADVRHPDGRPLPLPWDQK